MNKHLVASLLAIPAMFLANQAFAQCNSCNGGGWINGTQLNGLPTPGPLLQGTQINGLSAGPIVQAIQASVAPNWSALPASQLSVRLAPAI